MLPAYVMCNGNTEGTCVVCNGNTEDKRCSQPVWCVTETLITIRGVVNLCFVGRKH